MTITLTVGSVIRWAISLGVLGWALSVKSRGDYDFGGAMAMMGAIILIVALWGGYWLARLG